MKWFIICYHFKDILSSVIILIKHCTRNNQIRTDLYDGRVKYDEELKTWGIEVVDPTNGITGLAQLSVKSGVSLMLREKD